MVDALPLPHVARCKTTSQSIRVEENASPGGLSIFIEQFQTDVTHTGLTQGRQPLDSGLCSSVEQGVATAQVRPQWMLDAAAIPKRHTVCCSQGRPQSV